MNAPEVDLRRLGPGDAEVFLAAAARSASFHLPWVSPPRTRLEFEEYATGANQECLRYGVWSVEGELVGVVNINAIIRGAFQNGSLGFYAFAGRQGRGFMSAALRRLLYIAFAESDLHRLEANIQPNNVTSRRLVERLGFRSEGLGRRLLMVAGRWMDHERFALTAEEWILDQARPM